MRKLSLCLVFLLAGCATGGFSGMYQLPLPGGADLGEHPYRVVAQFGDVLDLVPQAGVKVHDVAVGRVDRIELAEDNRTAVVTMLVNGDVHLPANAAAELRQSSLLGEKFVELRAPDSPEGTLRDGAVIPIDHTNRNPEIEEVLGALSLLLNGGGISQLSTIVDEVNQALDGNEPELRATLANIDSVVTVLDSEKNNITKAIDALGRLSGRLAAQTDDIKVALDRLGPGLAVVNEQRDALVTMLGALENLSTVAVDTVERSRDDLVDDLKLLAPTLNKLAEAGSDLPNSLQFLVTYPFTDYFLNAVKGDYVNVDVKFDLDLSVLLENLENASTPIIPIPGLSPAPGPAPSQSQEPLLPVPTLPQVPQGDVPGGLTGLLGSLLGVGR
ncbi:MCE family protein [Actinophytocola algeriensis]|uniref:Phospholipid/cholesterol/gamma-HCH transport system substrate-binding protein n=1 Tax=Actinophytocola algeriensis TaxID=1768010 RepID=A0A7W7PZP5_9PSEU|nr:MCE family protein [Actinophytocola algeriensis]MBB4904136.1 phospholipid/cholesterol/gamma-HCH transport system substrate-binding protein [Actinophytocola algeriensis]MBE1477007.1 phospholipid/cholesterol/gamma-HCH transport system substrate-binding protein [Actinophytocola algeriensis]